MPRRLPSLACTIALAASALHCGASSTAPISNTPTANGSPSAIGGDQAQASSESTAHRETSAAAAPTAAGSPSTETPAASEIVKTSGKDTEAEGPLSDGEILAIADAANAAELERARLAQSKGQNPRVKDYAAMILDHYGRAREEHAQLGLTKAETSRSTAVTRDALSMFQRLQQKKGAAFDRAYIQLQIATHTAALNRLDRELLPAVRDARLRRYLEDVRPRVEIQLAKAQQIQEELAAPGVDPRLTTEEAGSSSK